MSNTPNTDTLEDQANKLAETILALKNASNGIWVDYGMDGTNSLCDTEDLQSIVREWKEMKQLLGAARSISGADWGVQLDKDGKWLVWCDEGEGGQLNAFDSPFEARAAIQKENK